MRRFKYREVFNRFFPFYFKENDSYKNEKGEGLLERFLNICMDYFDNEVTNNPYNPGLDNFISLIDIDTTPDLFLNYLWEYLGEIPYAWGLLTNGKPYTQENLKEWIYTPRGYPQANPRQVLKYAISLYKIRGTTTFYHLLGKIYGVDIEILNSLTGGDIVDENFTKAVYVNPSTSEEIVSTHISEWGEITSKYPSTSTKEDCSNCIPITVNIKIPEGMYDALESSEYFNLDAVQKAFVSIIDKYIPVFCKINTKDDGTLDVNLIKNTLTLLIRANTEQ